MINGSTYFPALTGMRAIAAYMIFVHHYRPFNSLTQNKFILDFTQELHVGVTLFFVLSGFLIAMRYFDLNRIHFKTYLVNRFARIFPIYFLLTSVTFLLYSTNNIPLPTKDKIVIYLYNISFLRGFFEDLVYTGISQGWSLSVEETFYILAPFLFLFLRKRNYFLLVLPALFLLSGFILTDLCKDLKGYGFMRNNDFMLSFTFFGRCTEFFIGIALAMLVKNKNLIIKTRFMTYLGLILLIIGIWSISLFKGNSVTGLFHPAGRLINSLILPLSGVALLYYGLIKEKTLLSKLLSSKVFTFLGKSSYVFYLIHLGIFSDLIGRFTDHAGIAFLLLNGIACLIYYYIERPLNTFIRKKFGGSEMLLTR